MIKSLLLCLLCPFVFATTNENEEPTFFYVYSDKGAQINHYVPSGWMGDYGDLKIDDRNTESPKSGKTAIKWTYNAKKAQGANWAGCYWQNPANNWGDKDGGFNLTGYKRLKFWAKGAKGGERIDTFKVGGITGPHADSDTESIGPITLTQEWKEYTINLANLDLQSIIGGFAWAASGDDNPDGFVIFLDEIRFEK